MENDLKSSLLAICSLLEKHHIQYMLIGGTAVALNGYYRHSINITGELTEKPDIDLWYNPTYENYFQILKVMEDLDGILKTLKMSKVQIHINLFSN